MHKATEVAIKSIANDELYKPFITYLMESKEDIISTMGDARVRQSETYTHSLAGELKAYSEILDLINKFSEKKT